MNKKTDCFHPSSFILHPFLNGPVAPLFWRDPMRIAIIAEVFLPKIDGVVNRTLNLIRHLQRSGDDLLVVCPQAQGCTECPVPVMDVPSFSFPLYPEYRVGLPDRRLAL